MKNVLPIINDVVFYGYEILKEKKYRKHLVKVSNMAPNVFKKKFYNDQNTYINYLVINY